MNPHIPFRIEPSFRTAQRGVVLFFALIALVAMSLAAVALIRSVDTSTIIAGNLALTPNESKENGRRFMNYAAEHAYTMTLAVSLGHTRTLIEHPASMTHSMIAPAKLLEYGIDPGGIRIALGLENTNDILMDLDECLNKV